MEPKVKWWHFWNPELNLTQALFGAVVFSVGVVLAEMVVVAGIAAAIYFWT